MATDEKEFKIKGAASSPSSGASRPTTPEEKNQPDAAEDVDPEAADKAEEVNSSTGGSEYKPHVTETAENLAKYKWYMSDTDPPSEYKQWFHGETFECNLYPPNEPYWVWDIPNRRRDPCGLQYPAGQVPREEALGLNKTEEHEEYTGYNPKIHGNYDPNADYAQYHNKKRAQEAAAAAGPYGTSQASGVPTYDSVVTLNKFTGHAQKADLGPERHSDQAKSGRQMNAFFDVDAAANAHNGESQLAQRREKRLSKKEVQEFRRNKKEKQRKKQLEFYTS